MVLSQFLFMFILIDLSFAWSAVGMYGTNLNVESHNATLVIAAPLLTVNASYHIITMIVF